MGHHCLFEIDERWAQSYEYYLLPGAQSIRRLLLEQCPETLLDTLKARFHAKEVWTTNSYIEICLELPENKQHFHLRMIGYTEYPRWLISGHNERWEWFTIEIANEDISQTLQDLKSLPESDKVIYNRDAVYQQEERHKYD